MNFKEVSFLFKLILIIANSLSSCCYDKKFPYTRKLYKFYINCFKFVEWILIDKHHFKDRYIMINIFLSVFAIGFLYNQYLVKNLIKFKSEMALLVHTFNRVYNYNIHIHIKIFIKMKKYI